MVRSYDISFTGRRGEPWSLYLYEGEELLDILEFPLYNDAQKIGEKFLDGQHTPIKLAK